MIGTLLLIGIAFVAGSIFTAYFDEIIDWADRIVDRIINGIRSILVFAIKAGYRVFSKLYTRYANGKITVSESEEEIDIDDIDDIEIRNKLMRKKEVDIKEYNWAS